MYLSNILPYKWCRFIKILYILLLFLVYVRNFTIISKGTHPFYVYKTEYKTLQDMKDLKDVFINPSFTY